MQRYLSARARLTALYTSLFAVCGGVLVAITYGLLAHNLQAGSAKTSTQPSAQQLAACAAGLTNKGVAITDAKKQCGQLFAKGAVAGASEQRSATLDHLLLYSLLTLAGVLILAAVAGWVVAGRILRPVHQLTAAARAASEQNLSHRLALSGPRDELRELADTFDAMLDRLDRAFTGQRQFIANASHELRTPLTVMRTSIDVVLGKPDPSRAELVSMATDVRHAVGHAERLIEALLVLARSERPRRAGEPLDLATIAEDALDGRTSDGLTVRCTLDEAPVTGDALLLERLVGNLLDNAQQYNVPGGTVAVATAAQNGTALLRVVNTGVFVPPGEVDRLFLPFTRLDDRTRQDGFGLGLALVASIASAHGGSVQAVAVPTGGLDVTVRLPRRLVSGTGSAVPPPP